MNCAQIIKSYLVENGFEGLFCDNCGCDLDDLMPCDSVCSECTPGYQVMVPDDIKCDYNWYICKNKDDKPWEVQDADIDLLRMP
jgi:hypothetical protein